MRRRDQARASRAALITAARECFAEFGYDATTVAEILRRAGMARGALYHYFPEGKSAVFAAVYDSVDDLLHAEVDRVAGGKSHVAAVRAGLAVYLRFCTQDAYSRITILDAPRVIPGQRLPRDHPELGRAHARLRGELLAALTDGELEPVDPDMLAAALYGATQELGARIYAAADRAGALQAAVAAVNLVIDGLARRCDTHITSSKGKETG